MRDVVLVLRGLWFRRWTSVAVLVVSAVVVGAAATGPLFLRAAGESVLRDTVAQAAPSARVVDDRLELPLGDDPLPAVERVTVTKLRPLTLLAGLLGPPTRSLEVASQVGPPGTTGSNAPLVFRDGVCAHVRVVTGRCPTAADGATRPGPVMISAPTAEATGWRVGRRLVVGDRPVTVVGTYVPLDLSGDYWSLHQYFQAQRGAGGVGLDAVLAPLEVVQRLDPTTLVTATVDRRLHPERLRLRDVPRLRQEVANYSLLRFAGPDDANGTVDVSTAIISTLAAAGTVVDSLRLPVLVVTAQLLLLCWLVLFLVVSGGAEARGPEVALAKLRGVPTAVTLGFGVADSLLLVALSVPLGLGLAWVWVGLLARLQLAPGTPVELTAYAALAAVGAGAGAAAAAVLAAWSTLRRPVVEQWRRTTRRGRPRPWALDVVVVALAGPGAVLLLLQARGLDPARAGDGPGAAEVLTLAAPGLLVLAVAMLASRALPAVCRALFAHTRRRPGGAAFLAVRQVARRPSTLRQALVLAVAFGLVTFAVAAWSVARSNAHDRAWTEVGAADVLDVYAPDRQDLAAVVDRLDPSGRRATVVSEATDFEGNRVRELLAVQPDRFARIGFWRDDLGPAPLATLADRLEVPTAPVVEVAGDRLAVDLTASPGLRGASLVADLAAPGAGPVPVTLGTLRAEARGSVGEHLEAEVPCATVPCRLAGWHLEPAGSVTATFSGELLLRAVDVRDASGRHRVDGDLARASWWRTAQDVRVTATPAGLRVVLPPGSSSTATWTVADHPEQLPALVSPRDASGDPVAGLDGRPLPLRVVGRTTALPNAGATGVVVARDLALRAADGSQALAQDTVWLAPGQAASVTRRLEAAGVSVLGRQSAAELTDAYRRQGPALALLLFVAVAGLGAVLAAGGTVLSLHLAGRRRSYEIAAMRSVGVRRRTLVTAVVAEQGLLVAFGLVVGVASGWVAAWLTLPTVPEFADVPTAPPLLFGVPAGPVLAVAGVAAVLLGGVVVLTARSLVRSAGFDQLREAPA